MYGGGAQKLIIKQECYLIVYSRASDNGPSEKRTASLQRTTVVLRIVSSITLLHT